MATDEKIETLSQTLVKGEHLKVKELTQQLLDSNYTAGVILNQGLIAGMNIVSQKFENNEFYVPQVLLAARAMTSGLEVLKPLLQKEDVKKFARVVIGTAFGDIHDIGKNLVTIMLEGGGFEVFDLGTSIAPDKFVSTAAEKDANLICISALMTTTMPSMKDTIEALKKQSLKQKIGVIIGGACVTQDYADEIGADGYAEDAISAVAKAKEIIENQRM